MTYDQLETKWHKAGYVTTTMSESMEKFPYQFAFDNISSMDELNVVNRTNMLHDHFIEVGHNDAWTSWHIIEETDDPEILNWSLCFAFKNSEDAVVARLLIE